MEKDIKEIKVINFNEIYKNSKELTNIFYIFEEVFEENKWIFISNKDIFLNKEIMACYPNFLNNFQNLYIGSDYSYNKVLEIIEQNSEYSKNGIKWDIQTYRESINSFYEKWHPFESEYYSKGRIYYHDKFTFKNKDNKIQRYNNDPGWGNIIENGSGLLIPIFRLGKEKDYIKFENGEINELSYSLGQIIKLFLEKDLYISKIFNNEELKNEFIKVKESINNYLPFIKDIKKEEKKVIIDWEVEKILETFTKIDDIKLFENIEIKYFYLNGDEELKKYINKEKIESKYFFKDGSIEEFKYINNIREGKTKIIYSNGEIKEANYQNGKLEGKSEYKYNNETIEEFEYVNNIREGKTKIIYSNGEIEEANYQNGKLQGESIYTYINGDVEIRNYIDGVLQGEAILKNKNGEIIRLYYTDGIKKDVTKLYNLLNIDKIRVNLDKYDESILYDVGGGHWDLYNNSEKEELEKEIGKKVYARDPRLDIKKGGIVGIDFGTKSTVVVFQDDKNRTLPMRISGTILNKKVENSDYENPTVIEFKDIETFIKDYNENLGRPFTKWTDVTVSHTAFQSLVNCSKENYYSVVSELKQWAGNKKEKLLIKDEKGIEKEINPYLELTEEDIDPIEIYAYYIGSYINNMRNGIYLEYFLSFPVTYEKEIREKILSSFERGIKKSLPKVIIEDENIMKKFKVKHGANEPAAYAVCALQEYGFDPEDDEKVYYGVFDFGGGTLDFDFGIFRESEDIRYDYDLEHFGAGGDRYLGGENILKELAYEVFKDKENIEVLRKENISFARPEWCDRFIGDETFVDSNGNSKLNIKFLMEKLRGIWENTEPNIEEKIKLNLFNKNGEPLTGIEINLDIEKIKNKIYSKIEGGIRNFFIAMEKAFKNDEYDKIYILLAGNSCKHTLVKEIFEKYIQEKEMNIEILPALGTEEAYAKLQEREIEIDREDMTKPTGKTGVAYGLLESTADSNIKVINRDENHNNEINFKYYVGNEKKKKLKPVLNPSVEYDTFNLFSYVKSDVFNIYYTTLPEASEGKMPIENVKRVRVSLNKEYDSETMIYIKAVGADTIEYVVTEKDINEKEYLESGKITLD
ncbi:hypothetical protein [uncultured Fusobacterium sp.]|uniref:hypothetical protein n=1 Tax=uncultured Fusobacterium sp. TaxID=159267 RepID=UPI0025EC8EA5|nr:hypothetical protein [uncultured Fusobacterium sp.]